MKVLVVGGGGREHALCWKIGASPLVEEVLCAPGNAGTAKVARNVPIAANDLNGLVQLARDERVGLVVVGPEEPLCAGLADRLAAEKIAVFGPGAAGARLEGSKVFAKEFLQRHRIPTAASRRFDRSGAAKSHLESLSQWPQVIKADGLAAGKGVFIVHSAREGCTVIDSLMEERRLGEAGAEIVIEEHLVGEEVSVHAITDGETLLVLEPVMDHKQVGEGDTGPNTGGMGVVSPVPSLSKRIDRQVEQHILVATLHGMRLEGIAFRGVLFVGLMLTESGPKVLEYNCRFGDPEVEAVLRRLQGDLVPYLLAAAQGKLAELEAPRWDPRWCVGVVAASEGYPGTYRKGAPIHGIEAAEGDPEAVVFHGGTRLEKPSTEKSRAAPSEPTVVTDGGRVLCVTALGENLHAARERAYAAYDKIRWDGKFCRRDIGLRRAPQVPASERTGDRDSAGGGWPVHAPRRNAGG
jgi:phosphoribosylamine---glycine ligase